MLLPAQFWPQHLLLLENRMQCPLGVCVPERLLAQYRNHQHSLICKLFFSYVRGTYFAFLGGCMPSRWPAKYPHNRCICFACHFSVRGWHVFFAFACAVLAPASFIVGKSDPVPFGRMCSRGIASPMPESSIPPELYAVFQLRGWHVFCWGCSYWSGVVSMCRCKACDSASLPCALIACTNCCDKRGRRKG